MEKISNDASLENEKRDKMLLLNHLEALKITTDVIIEKVKSGISPDEYRRANRIMQDHVEPSLYDIQELLLGIRPSM